MPRRPKNVSKEDRDTTTKLAQNLSAVVTGILRSRGMTQMALAHAAGYARSSMNQVLNPAQANYKWTLKMIVAVAAALDTTPSQLIAMAEAWDNTQQNRDELEISIQVFGSEPRTPERLQALINGVLNSNTNTEDVTLFEIGCPAFYRAYIKGDLLDLEVWDMLKAAAAKGATTSSGTPLPLWATLAKTYHK